MNSPRISALLPISAVACATVAGTAGAGETRTMTPVVVTAPALQRNVFQTPTVESPALAVAISVIDTNDLARQNPRTLTDALNYSAGALTETRGRKVKQFTSFRGQRYPYPDYAIGGTWLPEFHELPYFFPVAQLERIEVIRSSAALLVGLSGLAGVINVIPKPWDATGNYVELEYGSYNSVRGYAASGLRTPGGGVAAGVGYYGTDGPNDMNARERLGTLSAMGSWDCGEYVSVEANVFHISGMRELRRAEAPAAGRFRNTEEKYDPFAAWIVTVRGICRETETASTELMAHFADRSHEFKSTTGGAPGSTDERDYEYGASLIQAFSPIENNVLRVGALYSHWIAPDGKRFYAGRRTELHTVSGVAVAEHEFGPLHADAGVRYSQTYLDEYGAFNIEGSSRGLTRVAPVQNEWDEPVLRGNIGVKYQACREAALHLNVGGGVIEPRTGTLDVRLETPERETRINVDAGLTVECGTFGRVTLGGFYVERDEAILLSGSISTNADGRIMELYENRDLRQFGVEIDARTIEFAGIAGVFANATVMASEVKQGGSFETFKELPDVIVSAGVYSRVGPVDINLFGKYVSEFENDRFAADGLAHDLGDFVELNATAGVTVGSRRRARIYASVENLTDEEYSTVVGYPDFGARVKGGVQSWF